MTKREKDLQAGDHCTISSISCIGFILFQGFPRQIISLFGDGDEALLYDFAIHFMRTFLFMVIVNGVQLLSSNFFRGHRQTASRACCLSMTRQVFFLIPLVLILPLFIGHRRRSLRRSRG